MEQLISFSENDIVNKVWKYNNHEVHIYGTYNDIWFCGKDIAEILEYSDTTKQYVNIYVIKIN